MPKFQRRHYEAIADVMSTARRSHADLFEHCAIEYTIERMADVFERDNPRFDRDRFLIACAK